MNNRKQQQITRRIGDVVDHQITKSPHHHIAFTLTELLVVIGIIVLLMAVGVPSLKAMFASSRLDSAYTLVSSAVSAARTYAPRKPLVGADLQYDGKGAAAVFIQNAEGQIEIRITQHRNYSNATATPPTDAVYRDVLEPVVLGQTVGVAGIIRDSSGTRLILPPAPTGSLPAPPSPFGFAIRFDLKGNLIARTAYSGSDTSLKQENVWYNVNPTTATNSSNQKLDTAIGVIIFDRQAYNNTNPSGSNTLNIGSTEATWITTNGTAMMFNRYTGTVMKEQ